MADPKSDNKADPKADPKSNRPKARLPRGLADRGPAEIAATRAMIESIRKVYELYGFEPVETPAFEYGADRFDHAPGSRDLRRPAIGEPARQPRFELGVRHRESNRQVSGFQESGGHVVRARSLRQGDNVPTAAVQSLLNLPPRPRLH